MYIHTWIYEASREERRGGGGYNDRSSAFDPILHVHVVVPVHFIQSSTIISMVFFCLFFFLLRMTGFGFCVLSLLCAVFLGLFDLRAERILKMKENGTGEQISFKDIKDFPLRLWLVFIICVTYYVTVFPFIGLATYVCACVCVCVCVHVYVCVCTVVSWNFWRELYWQV